MFTDIKAAKSRINFTVFLGVVVLVSYLLASDAIPQFMGVQKFINDGTLTPQVAKLIDAGLICDIYIAGIGSPCQLFYRP